jgi:hypothetical protein
MRPATPRRFGACVQDFVDEHRQAGRAKCHVTENFGKVRKRTAAIDRVTGAWRPECK